MGNFDWVEDKAICGLIPDKLSPVKREEIDRKATCFIISQRNIKPTQEYHHPSHSKSQHSKFYGKIKQIVPFINHQYLLKFPEWNLHIREGASFQLSCCKNKRDFQ